MKKPSLVVATALFSLLSTSSLCMALESAATRVAAVCTTINLQVHPSWISSAVWVDSLSSIMLVDPLRSKVRLYSPDGAIRTFPEPKLAQGQLPTSVAKGEEKFYLKMVGSSIFMLDNNLRLEKSLNPFKESKSSRGEIGSLYQWVVAGDYLVAFGSIRYPEGSKKKFDLGLIRAPINNPSAYELLLPYEDGDYYVLGHPYLATVGQKAYFILMGERPTIYEIPAKSYAPIKPLNAFPPDYRQAPKLKSDMSGPNNARVLFDEIESLSIPAGMYGFRDKLYLLTRKPSQIGTEWTVFQINPSTDEVVGSVPLKMTSAHHLTLVPADDWLYIFERGRVGSYGEQDISDMLKIPSSWIAELKMPANVSCPSTGKH